MKAVDVQINVKDLAEHGLRLIPPTDPSFQATLSTMLEGKENPLAEALRPYSVIFENKAKKVIAGYRVTWEMTKADGTASVQQAGGVNTGALMDRAEYGLESTRAAGEFVIEPNSIALVSVAGSLNLGGGGTIIAYGGSSADPALIDQFRSNAKTKSSSSLADTMIADLWNHRSITASIDGVLFEDGTFVGPDNSGWFATVEASLNARRDLLEEVAMAVERKRSLDQIFSDIELIANVPVPDGVFTREEIYNLFKRIEAEGLLRMRSILDGQRALDISLQDYRRAWPKLEKL